MADKKARLGDRVEQARKKWEAAKAAGDLSQAKILEDKFRKLLKQYNDLSR
jgi:hypothetical protein